MKGRIYGNERTELTLTTLADKMYCCTDPCDIMECDTPDGLRYRMRTDYTDGYGEYMTAEEVNETLESYADDDMEFTLNTDAPEKWGSEAENGMIVSLGEIRRLAKEWGVPVENLLNEVK